MGYLVVDFHRPIRIQRDEIDGDVLNREDYYPDDVDTWLGVSALRCSSNISLPTTTRVSDKGRAAAAGVLYPVAEVVRSQSLGLLSIARARAATIGSKYKTPAQRYEAVYFFKRHIEFGDGDNGDPEPHLMASVRSGQCRVIFLSKAEQRLQGGGIPPGRVVIGTGTTEVAFEGSVAVRPWREPFTSQRPWPRTSVTDAGNGPWATSRLKYAIKTYADGLTPQDMHEVMLAYGGNGRERDRSQAECLALPRGIKQYASDMAAADSAFIEVRSKARVESIAEEIPKLIKTPVSDVLKPVMKLTGAFLGETLVEPIKEQMGELTSAGMVDQIDEGLSGALIRSLSKGIPATTLETIPFVVSEGLAESLMLYITEQVTNEITGPLADRLADALGETIPAELDTDGVAKLAERVSTVTIHSLTRSVTHSVVPALVHTLTHSPLQDFYCYYCFHHKAYCQFCQYAPQQLYYAMYYAGFYSSYYSSYYA